MNEKEILLYLYSFIGGELESSFNPSENPEWEAYSLSRCLDYCNEILKDRYGVYGTGQTLTSIGKIRADLLYDYDPNAIVSEPCPGCGHEIDIRMDGTSSCEHCNFEDILPCSECVLAEKWKCDWNELTRCTVFPMEANEPN